MPIMISSSSSSDESNPMSICPILLLPISSSDEVVLPSPMLSGLSGSSGDEQPSSASSPPRPILMTPSLLPRLHSLPLPLASRVPIDLWRGLKLNSTASASAKADWVKRLRLLVPGDRRSPLCAPLVEGGVGKRWDEGWRVGVRGGKRGAEGRSCDDDDEARDDGEEKHILEVVYWKRRPDAGSAGEGGRARLRLDEGSS